jgi:hypothetical protein
MKRRKLKKLKSNGSQVGLDYIIQWGRSSIGRAST